MAEQLVDWSSNESALELTDEQAAALENEGLIHYCPDCGFYHPWAHEEDIQAILDDLKGN